MPVQAAPGPGILCTVDRLDCALLVCCVQCALLVCCVQCALLVCCVQCALYGVLCTVYIV